MLEFLQLGLGKVLHLTVQKLLRISTFGKVKGAPFIGILKDEPFASSDGFIVTLLFHHPQPFSKPPFQDQPSPGWKGQVIAHPSDK
jgi:hypothetical protein